MSILTQMRLSMLKGMSIVCASTSTLQCAPCSFALERIKKVYVNISFNENAFAFTCYFIKGIYKLEETNGVVGDSNLIRPFGSPVY